MRARTVLRDEGTVVVQSPCGACLLVGVVVKKQKNRHQYWTALQISATKERVEFWVERIWEGAVLVRVVRESPGAERTSELRDGYVKVEGQRSISCWGNSVSGRGNSKGKHTVADPCLVRKRTKASSIGGTQWAREELWGMRLWRARGWSWACGAPSSQRQSNKPLEGSTQARPCHLT